MSLAGPVAHLRAQTRAVGDFAGKLDRRRLVWRLPGRAGHDGTGADRAALAMLASVVTTFAGLVADLLQLWTGIQGRRVMRSCWRGWTGPRQARRWRASMCWRGWAIFRTRRYAVAGNAWFARPCGTHDGSACRRGLTFGAMLVDPNHPFFRPLCACCPVVLLLLGGVFEASTGRPSGRSCLGRPIHLFVAPFVTGAAATGS